MARTAALLVIALSVTACTKPAESSATAKRRPNVCTTDAAMKVTHQPEFKAAYDYCATGSRAIGGPATIACLEKQSGLPEDCASCYSWYKACVLRHCFNACKTTRPEPNCLLCSRNNCRGMFLQCSGTTDVFPGSPRE